MTRPRPRHQFRSAACRSAFRNSRAPGARRLPDKRRATRARSEGCSWRRLSDRAPAHAGRLADPIQRRIAGEIFEGEERYPGRQHRRGGTGAGKSGCHRSAGSNSKPEVLRSSPAQRSLSRRRAGEFLVVWRAEPALCGLLRNSPAQRSLSRRRADEFLVVWRAEPALCGLLRNSPAQRSLSRRRADEFLVVWRAEPALCGLQRTFCSVSISFLNSGSSRSSANAGSFKNFSRSLKPSSRLLRMY